MDLQIALLLIGVVIIAVVALSVFDRARLTRRFREAEAREHAKFVGIADKALALIDKAFRPASRLDFNPSPDVGTNKRYLRGDATLPETGSREKTDDDIFYETLESFEQMASIPLDVDLGMGEPILEAVTGEEPERSEEAVSTPQNMPDAKIDFIINLPGRGPVTRNKALGIYKQREYELTRPRGVYGLRYVGGVWSNLDKDPETTQYSDLSLAIQLLDSKGPIDESELTTFGQIGLKLADVLDRPTRLSMTYEQAVERARELDRFCKKFDAIASINVVPLSEQGFPGRALEQVAGELGMQFGAMNIFHKKNDEALGCRHVYSMADLYEPGEFRPETFDTYHARGLTLFMQIPCTHSPVSAFDQMTEAAEKLCQKLEGKMLDHDKRPLTEKGLMVIRDQIQMMTREMQAEGITPGSETALRLFNT